MSLVAFDIDGTLREYGGIFSRVHIDIIAKRNKVVIVSARGDCAEVAKNYGIETACCGDKVHCLKKLAQEVSHEGGQIYIADLLSDFEAAKQSGWNWADVNSLCVNIGAGASPIKSCINIDIRPLKSVDLVMDITEEWPFPDKSIASVYAYDIIEHIPWRLQERLWETLSKKVKPGGKLVVRVPGMELICDKVVYKRGEKFGFKYRYQAVSYWVGGGQDYPENTHFTFFTSEALEELANAYGFYGRCGDDGGTNLLCTFVRSL